MRYLILILILLMGCATTLPPAGPAKVEMRKADRVILIPKDTTDIYKQLGRHLTDQGFSISNSDQELGTIQTAYNTFSNPLIHYNISVNASIRDTTVHFYGQIKLGTSEEIRNQGMGGSAMQQAWKKLVTISKEFPHNEIYYSRN